MTPGLALLPLRLFLGATFAYAGLQKLSDGGFLVAGSDTYIGTQLEGFARGTPGGWLLETFALPHPELAGVGVAVAEIAIGVLVLAGRFTRAAAAAGLGLNLVLFLTATWHTSPYFLGSDIVFVFAWLPFVLAGADGQPALDHVPARAVRLRPVGAGPLLTRRAAIGQALGFAGVLTGLLAGVGVLVRGPAPAPEAKAAVARRPEPIAASADVAAGDSLGFTNPADGTAALLIRERDGTLAAVSRTCTHAGCDVEWHGGRLICPCHRSTFDPETGEPHRGPATEPLTVLPVVERGGQILLG
jgi:thiosulfate dehydrogenase [quinone] large subunit